MPAPKLWPGQVQKANFTLAQVRALSSVVRSEVYWAFSPHEPRSTNQVAEAIRRTAPTVRYHVNELLRADMLMAVETRKKRSRTEEAYVHRIVKGFTPPPPFSKEYMAEMNRGFAAILRAMEKEREACHAVGNIDVPYDKNNLFRHAFLKLRPEKIAALRQKLADLVYEYWDDEDEDGMSIHVAAFYGPTLLESQRRYKELTGKDLRDSEDEEA